jgi:imidazolonepropionase-like amidohydrolase
LTRRFIEEEAFEGVASIEHGSCVDDEGIRMMKEHGTCLVLVMKAGTGYKNAGR